MNTQNYKIDIKKVSRVYSGKPGCMCGCKGKYYSMSATKENPHVNVNPSMVSKVVNILNDGEAKFNSHGSVERYAYLQIGNRSYVAYFTDENLKIEE